MDSHLPGLIQRLQLLDVSPATTETKAEPIIALCLKETNLPVDDKLILWAPIFPGGGGGGGRGKQHFILARINAYSLSFLPVESQMIQMV